MSRPFEREAADPFAHLTAPPVDETPEQRRVRERNEEKARKINDEIDEALKLEREELRAKRRNRLKVLLLGQSESGTSKKFIYHSFLVKKGWRVDASIDVSVHHLMSPTPPSVFFRPIVFPTRPNFKFFPLAFPPLSRLPDFPRSPDRYYSITHMCGQFALVRLGAGDNVPPLLDRAVLERRDIRLGGIPLPQLSQNLLSVAEFESPMC